MAEPAHQRKLMRVRSALLLRAGVALTLGIGYYLWRRPDALVTVLFGNLTGVTLLDIPCPIDGSMLMQCIDGYLADFLWGFAMMLCMGAACLGTGKMRAGLALCLAADCIMELLQGVGLISGTFDPVDMLVQIGGTIAAQCIINLQRRKNYVGKQQ